MITLTNISREELTALCNMTILNANYQKDRVRTALDHIGTPRTIKECKRVVDSQDEIIQLAGKVLIDLS